jgi:hypothetical protein
MFIDKTGFPWIVFKICYRIMIFFAFLLLITLYGAIALTAGCILFSLIIVPVYLMHIYGIIRIKCCRRTT